METALVPLKFEGREIRRGVDEAGEPIWVAMDVCQAIGLADTNKAVSKLDADDTKTFRVVDAAGRERMVTAVNESGLYTLVLRSNKPEAKRFKKWVTSEVLPSIRKTGAYSISAAPLKLLPDASAAFEALYSVAGKFGFEGNQRILSASKAVRTVAGVDFPELLGATHLIAEKQVRHFTPTELGERLDMSARAFNLLLASSGLQEKRGDAWCATETGKPFAVLLDTGKKHSNGTPVQQLRWTEDVLEKIDRKTA